MADMQYTVEQQDAIDRRGTDLLVSAAAGSGKTQVLVERIIQMMLRDRIPVRRMLVVTFTNAAAGEMKERLQVGLTDALAQMPEEAAFVRAQLRELPQANVCTMHAFCTTLLRRYAYAIDLDPGFRTLNAATQAILREDAIDRTMEAYYLQDDADFLDLVAAHGGKNGDEGVRAMVRQLADFMQASPDPQAWVQEALSRYQTAEDAVLYLEDPYMQPFLATVHAVFASALETLTQCEAQIALYDELSPYLAAIAADRALIEQAQLSVQQATTPDHVFRAISKFSFSRLATVRGLKDMPEDISTTAEAYKSMRDAFIKKPLTKLSDRVPSGGSAQVLRDRRIVHARMHTLVQVTTEYLAHYTDLKTARNRLDFNDLEHETVRLLAEPDVRHAIQEDIGFIFFDEYQDSNPVQEHIVQQLASPDGLFFVGDVKQAIYRFRLSDPGLFNRRYAAYHAGDGGTLLHLSRNFRSERPLIDFINAVFTPLMTPALGEVDYVAPGQALVCGREENTDAKVQMVTIDTGEINKADWSVQALWIATEIQRLVDKGSYRYGDMVVLMRSPAGVLADYEAAFKYYGIPYYCDNTTVSFENMEVHLFLSMLQVINNHHQDEALAAVLLSPFGGFNDSDLAQIRLMSPQTTFARACLSYPTEDDILKRLQQFFGRLNDWRQRLQTERLTEVGEALLDESGYGAFLLSLAEGGDKYENVKAFINLMTEFEAESVSGLQGFLHHTTALKKQRGDSLSPAIALADGDNRVRLMSIHKSKGLGFKVVFLAEIQHGFNFTDRFAPLMKHNALGLAMRAVSLDDATEHTTFEAAVIGDRLVQETCSEEVRLLYVALTRAKEQLYLIGNSKKPCEQLEKAGHGALSLLLAESNTYQGWLFALRAQVPALSPVATSPLYDYQVVDGKALLDAMTSDETDIVSVLPPTDPTTRAQLQRILEYQYPHEAATRQPLKVTVSDIAAQTREDATWRWPSHAAIATPAVEAVRPQFLAEHVSFTAMEAGTILHRVMQLIPMRPMQEEEIKTALQALEDRALLTAAEHAAVDTALIVRFFESDLGKDILRHADTVEREKSFTMVQDGVLVDGQIDLFYRSDDGYRIVDFKSDRTQRADAYAVQMHLYRQALSLARHENIASVWLYWLRFGSATEVLM